VLHLQPGVTGPAWYVAAVPSLRYHAFHPQFHRGPVHPGAIVAVSDGADDCVGEGGEVERVELFSPGCPWLMSEVPATDGEKVEGEVGQQTVWAGCPWGAERAHQDLEVRSIAN
jgi:hypothetical protein